MALLLLDETAGDLPIRDGSPKSELFPAALTESVAQLRQHMNQVCRVELEDGFLHLHDENQVLKEFACKQEARIKRLGTKLLRFSHKQTQAEGRPGSRARWSGQNLDLDESLEELQERVQDVEQRNKGLRSRLLSYKQQLQLHGCRYRCPYNYIQPRVDTGLCRTHATGKWVIEKPHRGEEWSRTGSLPNSGDPGVLLFPALWPVFLESGEISGEQQLGYLSSPSKRALLFNSPPHWLSTSIPMAGGSGSGSPLLCLSQVQERLWHLEKERDLLKEDYDKLLESFPGHAAVGVGLVIPSGLSASPSFTKVGWGHLYSLLPVSLQPPGPDSFPTETEQEEQFTPCSLSRRLHEMEAAHADTILELEKTRDMLILQHRINRDYQAELEGVMAQAEQEQREHEEKQQKMVRLLDLRCARIRQLEEHLKDVVYGTQPLPLPLAVDGADVEPAKAPLLRRGENLFELHIAGAVLSSVALQRLGDVQPVTFCTYSFYDFETHCTPVVRGVQPRYSFTSQYVVQAEPLFLQYLQGAAACLDLHLATATEHSTLASCGLRFGAVLWSGGRVHATVVLRGPSGENYGTLEYWMRLHLPLEWTMQLHLKSTKALGYLIPQEKGSLENRHMCSTVGKLWLLAAQEPCVLDAEGLWNELQVQIGGCSSLQGRWLGTQPSPYAMYRFFTFPDHDTPIVPSSNNPHFGDQRFFPLRPTAALDRYLRLESLCVYVFDDEDVEPGTYLGKAQIPLLPLAHGHSIIGNFVLTDPAGKPNGSISLSLEWKHRYLPLGTALCQAAQARDPQHDRPWEQLIEVERAALHSQVQNSPAAGLTAIPHDSTLRKWIRPWVEAVVLQEGTMGGVKPRQIQGNQEGPGSRDHASMMADAGQGEDRSLALPSLPPMYLQPQATERIRIEIISLSLHPETTLSEQVQQLYVEYRFPGVPLAETETPLSLGKPHTGREIYFHFSKVIALDPEGASIQRELLFSMLQAELPGQSWLQFMVVSEPTPGVEGECEDVGVSYVDLREILLTGRDVLDPQDLGSAIGRLKVSVEAAAALCAIYCEGRRKAEEE
uniref:RPGR interacting protein 1 n=1 Tax=Pelusios castaneus TaxID=367368 RepID=A0A8C8SEW7_9SAUR